MDYDRLVREALRGVVRLVLDAIAADGLTPPHHLYLTFRTDAEGVTLPPHLRARYPELMTIVLRNQFWDLAPGDDGFAVTLSFGGVREPVAVPYAAVTAMVDPSVPFGLQFERDEADAAEGGGATAEGDADEGADEPAEGSGNVVRLTDFRRPDES